MILTCPDCATSYSASDDAIGPNGRMVRCSNCKTTWFVSHDADTLELIDNQTDGLVPAEEPAKRGEFDYDGADSETEFIPPVKKSVGAHVQIRDKAEQKRRNRRLLSVSMIWLVTLGLLSAGLGMAYIFRQTIVDRTPAAATLYNAIGIPVKISGLDFESPKAKNILIDGEPVFVVNGFVRNLSGSNQPIPLIRLSLHNPAGEEVAHWFVEIDQPALPAGDRIEYQSQYPNPPIDARTLKYRFVDQSAPAALEAPVNMQ